MDETLTEFEKGHASAILRFAYDPGFEGKRTKEPTMELMESHIRSLAERISKHSESVACVECGMLGKWGEMHGSEACTTENFNKVLDYWLRFLDPNVRVSVRTPKQYCDYFETSIEDPNGQDHKAPTAGDYYPSNMYRVGIYDDGYLASDTDLGTYGDRQKEIAWLSKQARHAFFGGELGTSYGGSEVFPTAAYMSKEAFLTHLTYLNREWNYSAISALKQEIFAGENLLYQGETGYTYVKNHMGYRFVLRSVRITKEVPLNRRFQLELDIENVGFGNLIKAKNLELIIARGEEKVEVLAWDPMKDLLQGENLNATLWDSEKITTVKIYPLTCRYLEPGEYQVYIRIADSMRDRREEEIYYRYPIRFANAGDNVWSEKLEANFLGSFVVTQEREEIAWDMKEGFYWE
ncbi:MAG: DUF4832 domain-containing protein [Lachnospiraceae bacterium]|nr:DUF4832 domain-containing protein [Lachnospiraceae bacterium]